MLTLISCQLALVILWGYICSLLCGSIYQYHGKSSVNQLTNKTPREELLKVGALLQVSPGPDDHGVLTNQDDGLSSQGNPDPDCLRCAHH